MGDQGCIQLPDEQRMVVRSAGLGFFCLLLLQSWAAAGSAGNPVSWIPVGEADDAVLLTAATAISPDPTSTGSMSQIRLPTPRATTPLDGSS